jgi:hypothetical protein
MGMMKTGTSSIQRSLRGFADSSFVCYEDRLRRANHGHTIFGIVEAIRPVRRGRKLARAGKRARTEFDSQEGDLPEPDARERVDRAIQSLAGRSLIMTSEAMRLLTPSQIEDLAAYFQSRVSKLTVVGYVRPPVGFRTSVARATVGGSLRTLNFDNKPTHYRELFGKFDDVLGRENVLLWKFDPQSFPAGCVVQDFCTRLGIDFPKERIVRANESLPREAVALLYTYHKFGRGMGSRSMDNRQRLRLVQRLGQIGHTKFRFSPDLLRLFVERNRADIEWMEQRLGQSLDEDWREHRPDDVREYQDLLQPDPKVVERLREILGDAAPAGVKGETPEEVAQLVHALRGNREARKPWLRRLMPRRLERNVTPPLAEMQEDSQPDPVAKMEQTRPTLLNGIPSSQAQSLQHHVFNHIQDQLARTEQGTVNYVGLGRFRIARGSKGKNGTDVTARRILFHLPGDRTHA